MSECYADLLKDYPNKGECGLPESIETRRAVKVKVNKLVNMIQSANNVVIFTGAGISTSAGIPDFRGPNGIWTKEKREKENEMKRQKKSAKQAEQTESKPSSAVSQSAGESSLDTATSESSPQSPTTSHASRKRKASSEAEAKQDTVSFEDAKPTLTHRAITKLVELGKVAHVISQNVDGLHMRSGLPRSKLSVLHGCVFTLKCESCGKEYFQDKVIQPYSVGMKRVGKMCSEVKCGGHLRDTLLDWDDDLPDQDWARSLHECDSSDLVISLGTSLRIQPAGNLPLYAKEFVIVNKQVTPLDERAAMVIRANCDDILSAVMDGLGLSDWDDEAAG